MRNLKRALSLALASVMVLGMTVVGTGASYTDVTSKQNQEAIEVLQAVGIMVGDDNGNFNPDQKVTRNEMAVVMSNLMDYRAATYAGTSPFTDVPSWAEPYVAACWNNGITSGYTKTTYGGSDTVTTSQAALMLMKALGYFQYSSDFGSDWQFATIKQANKIDLFDDVDSGVRDAMTRNDLAQLVLNTLEAGTVEAEKDGQDIEVNGVTISSNVKYNYITSGKSYAYAINDKLDTANNGTNSTGRIVELGEKLYNGDLKKNDNGDNFNRPGSAWTYKSTEIGKYADSADGEWTAKVTNKALYDAAGSDAYDNYKWSVYKNGDLVAQDDVKAAATATTRHAGRDAAFGTTSTKTSSERVLTSGEGVLTQVFVDNTEKTVVLSLIDTGVAKVTKVTEDSAKGNYEVTVSFKTKVLEADGSKLTPDTKFTTDVKFAKDDVVVYTASVESGEIETMAKAKTVAGKVTSQKDADYTALDGTNYTYNYAYTDEFSKGFIANGLYSLDDSKIDNPGIDKDATLYLDEYGYAVAFEGKTSTAEDYLFVKSLDVSFGDDVAAKVVFFDGTQKTVDLDQITLADGSVEDAAYDQKNPTTFNAKTNNVQVDTIYKYTEGSSYDLEVVTDPVKAATAAKISNKNPSITGTGDKIVTDSQTVFVDVKNNKTWTGYKNVSNKTNASVKAVYNSDNVAEIVFIYGDFSGSANDDDFIILKGTGMAAEKKDGKNVYRFTDAYNVKGEKINDLYAANKMTGLSKGLYLIKDYTDDDYVQNLSKCLFTIKGDNTVKGGNTAAGPNASVYATAAKNGVLTLNKAIDLKADDGVDKDDKPTNTSDNRQTFSYDSKTTFIVITQKQSGDVDALTVSNDIGDIETWDKDSDNKDMTGVYVVTVDDDSDDTPLATCVIVVVPDIKDIK
jgi:hypothetical protein